MTGDKATSIINILGYLIEFMSKITIFFSPYYQDLFLLKWGKNIFFSNIYNLTTKLGSPMLIRQKQLESNESEFEGCWGFKNPTLDSSNCTTESRVAPQPYPWPKLSNRLLDSSSVAKVTFSCSRAVFEGLTQVNPALSLYFKPCESFNSRIIYNLYYFFCTLLELLFKTFLRLAN
jgi:hypothetical protein